MKTSPRACVLALLITLHIVAGATIALASDAVTPNNRVQEFVTLRSEPRASSDSLGHLNVGEQAELLGSVPVFFRVRLADGTEGFVLKSYTLVVQATASPAPGGGPSANAGLVNVPPVAPGSREMNAHFINVGQGAATLLEFPCGAILVDTGGEKNGDFDSNTELMAYLNAFFARRTDLHGLDALIITHPHVDHDRGACEVISAFPPKGIVNDSLPATGPAVPGDTCIQQAADGGTPHDVVQLSDVGRSGDTDEIISPLHCSPVSPTIRVLFGGVPQGADHLPGWTQTDAKNPNNNSVATRVDFGTFSILITGDLEERGIAELLEREDPAVLDVDVYEVGHHGSHNGTTAPLVAAMTPKVAIIEMGEKSRQGTFSAFEFGHPNKKAIDLLLDPQHGVSGVRAPVTEPVGISGRNPTTHAAPVWTTETVDRAIYGTGWDGTIVIHADDQGKFDIFTEK